jgi:hypothetical protein
MPVTSTTRRPILALGTLALSALAPPALAEEVRPNVVMIVVDDLRFDEIGVGGHPYLETPHIDLHEASLSYEHAGSSVWASTIEPGPKRRGRPHRGNAGCRW